MAGQEIAESWGILRMEKTQYMQCARYKQETPSRGMQTPAFMNVQDVFCNIQNMSKTRESLA
jgi:hypothetical protein